MLSVEDNSYIIRSRSIYLTSLLTVLILSILKNRHLKNLRLFKKTVLVLYSGCLHSWKRNVYNLIHVSTVTCPYIAFILTVAILKLQNHEKQFYWPIEKTCCIGFLWKPYLLNWSLYSMTHRWREYWRLHDMENVINRNDNRLACCVLVKGCLLALYGRQYGRSGIDFTVKMGCYLFDKSVNAFYRHVLSSRLNLSHLNLV